MCFMVSVFPIRDDLCKVDHTLLEQATDSVSFIGSHIDYQRYKQVSTTLIRL